MSMCQLEDVYKRQFLLYTVDDECSAEDFMTAMFRVDLCETKDFWVGEFTSQIVFYLFQVVPFFFGKGKACLLYTSRCV